MIMRSVLRAVGPVSLAVVAIMAPAPAMAREQSIAQAAERLSDPRMQGAIAGMLAAMTEAMMGMKMAPFAKAMDSMGVSMGRDDGDADHASRSIDPDATLGDMMGPEARRMPQELSARVPQMMDGMAGMAGAMEQMMPQLKEMAERMKDAMPRR
jgi:hypothetical protein